MELFSEVKNRYFQLIFRIVNECANGKSKSELLRIVDEGEFEQKLIGKNQQSFSDMILNRCSEDDKLNLLIQKEDLFYPSIENTGTPPLPVRFTNFERAWLRALLDIPEVKMILSKKTLEKLKMELDGLDTPIKDNYFEITNTIKLPLITNQEEYEQNFKILLNALIQEKPLRYSNIDRKGNIYENMLAFPVSLEYSMRDSRFRVSMYSIDDNRPIMANIFTMSDIRIVNEDVGIDRETAKKHLFQQKYSEDPVMLEVKDRRNAMERCFMCFSGMERTARDLGNNKYELRLNYYLFEEENLIRNIISLGPYVKVISPNRIADEIVRRVKKSIALYNE